MSGFGQAPWGSFPFGNSTIPPVLVNFDPLRGDFVQRLSTISFDVINPSYELSDLTVSAVSASGVSESVWGPTGFADLYRRGSSKLSIPYGARFILRRTNGWQDSSFRIVVVATDLAGMDVVLEE